MISQDFSTSSLCGEVAVEMSEVLVEDNLDMYQINARKIWEQRSALCQTAIIIMYLQPPCTIALSKWYRQTA